MPQIKINGKGIVIMDEKTKPHNALYMDGVKKKQLSVSRMCDNGFYVTFQFKDCDI